MVEMSSSLFTVGVFQDASSAEKGLQALLAEGFSSETVSLIAKHSPWFRIYLCSWANC